MNHALKERPTRVVRRHGSHGIKRLVGLINIEIVEMIDPAHRRLVDLSPVNSLSRPGSGRYREKNDEAQYLQSAIHVKFTSGSMPSYFRTPSSANVEDRGLTAER